MLNSFEKRLADLIADGLSTEAGLQLVTRPRSDLPSVASANSKAVVIVRLFDARCDGHMGDDGLERRGARGEYRLKTILTMSGTALLECRISPTGGASLEQRRLTLLRVVDSLMLFLHKPEVRNGKAFDLTEDQGFKIEGFRLDSLAHPTGVDDDFSRIELRYHFNGQFWPVEPEIEGAVITMMPSRLTVLPLGIPESITVKAGAPVQSIAFFCDKRESGGALMEIVARLRGASPAGVLSGDTTGLTGGWTSFPVTSSGECSILYAPPAGISKTVIDRLVVALRKGNGPGALLAESEIVVAP